MSITYTATEKAWKYSLSAGLLLTFVFLFIVTTFALVRSLSWPLIHDAPILHYIAREILSGKVPYKDIFDMNFPGTYMLHIGALTLLGGSDTGWRIFDLAWLALSILAANIYTQKSGKVARTFVPLFLIAFHLSNGPFASGQRDFIMAVLFIFSAHFLADYLENTINKKPLLFSGLILGFAITIKPFAIFLAGFFLLLLIKHNRDTSVPWHKHIGLFFLSSIVSPSIMGIWLIHTNAFPYFLEIINKYLIPLYSQIGRVESTNLLRRLFSAPASVSLIVLSIVLMLKINFNTIRIRYIIILIGIIYGAFHFVLQGRGTFYHAYPFMLFLLTLSGMLISDLAKQTNHAAKAAGFMLLLIVSQELAQQSLNFANQEQNMIAIKPQVAALSNDLSAHQFDKPNKVQVLDSISGSIHALYLLDLEQPTRFIYGTHFFHHIDNPYIQLLRMEFMADLRSKRPILIIISDGTWESGYYEELGTFPELVLLLEEEYTLEKTESGYSIYLHDNT